MFVNFANVSAAHLLETAVDCSAAVKATVLSFSFNDAVDLKAPSIADVSTGKEPKTSLNIAVKSVVFVMI
jgi:hypothetical protein